MSIFGSSAGLNNAFGVAVDKVNDQIFVSNTGDNSITVYGDGHRQCQTENCHLRTDDRLEQPAGVGTLVTFNKLDRSLSRNIVL